MSIPNYFVCGHGHLKPKPGTQGMLVLGPNQYVVFMSRPGFSLSERWIESPCLSEPYFYSLLPGFTGAIPRNVPRDHAVFFRTAFKERFYGPGNECPDLSILFHDTGNLDKYMGVWHIPKAPFARTDFYNTYFAHKDTWLSDVLSIGGPGLYVVYSCRSADRPELTLAERQQIRTMFNRALRTIPGRKKKTSVNPNSVDPLMHLRLNSTRQNIFNFQSALAGATEYTHAVNRFERGRVPKKGSTKRKANNVGENSRRLREWTGTVRNYNAALGAKIFENAIGRRPGSQAEVRVLSKALNMYNRANKQKVMRNYLEEEAELLDNNNPTPNVQEARRRFLSRAVNKLVKNSASKITAAFKGARTRRILRNFPDPYYYNLALQNYRALSNANKNALKREVLSELGNLNVNIFGGNKYIEQEILKKLYTRRESRGKQPVRKQ